MPSFFYLESQRGGSPKNVVYLKLEVRRLIENRGGKVVDDLKVAVVFILSTSINFF